MDVDAIPTSVEVNPVRAVLETPSSDLDSLSQLADRDADMVDDDSRSNRPEKQRGVRIDDHYYFHDEEPELVKKKPRKGVSDYQASWYVSDSGEDSESGEDENGDIEMNDEDNCSENFSEDNDGQSEIDTNSEMHIDLSPEEEKKQYRYTLLF